jgi:hypothetical protein
MPAAAVQSISAHQSEALVGESMAHLQISYFCQLGFFIKFQMESPSEQRP